LGRVICACAWIQHPGIGSPTTLQRGFDHVATELGTLLSEDATVTLPSSPEWDALMSRASYPRIHPGYNVVVEVATERDVQETVFQNKTPLSRSTCPKKQISWTILTKVNNLD
jgi:hypothetical protein